jgi:hypothetical protein
MVKSIGNERIKSYRTFFRKFIPFEIQLNFLSQDTFGNPEICLFTISRIEN